MRAFSARAEARSLPNGFSMMTRRKLPSFSWSSRRRPAARRWCRIIGWRRRGRRQRSRPSGSAPRLLENPVQPRIGVGLGQIAAEMGDAARHEFPGRGIERLGCRPGGGVRDKAPHTIGEIIAIGLNRLWRAVDSDDPEFVRQQLRLRQIVDGRHQQAPGQIAAGPKNHQGAGWRLLRPRLHRRAFLHSPRPERPSQGSYCKACSTARCSVARPVSRSPVMCARSARRPRSARTSRSPRACAALTTPKV